MAPVPFNFRPMLRELLENLRDELSSLKDEGVERVAVSDETLAALRKQVSFFAPEKTPPPLPSPEKTASRASVPLQKSEPEMTPDFSPIPMDAPEKPKISAPEKKEFSVAPLPPPPVLSLPEGDKESRFSWLREQIFNSPVCRAHAHSDTGVICGTGNLDAEILFCGDAPDADEIKAREPFAPLPNSAGEMLAKIISAMSLRREDVFLTTVMNWRPETASEFEKRPPSEEEVAFCLPFFRAQIAIIKPKVIVALGTDAVNCLFGKDAKRKISNIRGQWHSFDGVPVMPTYSPAYLVRNGTNKSKRALWEDLLLVMEKINLPVSEKQRGYFL